MSFSTQCRDCKNRILYEQINPEGIGCLAFPDEEGIPVEILTGVFDHTEPYPGDHGIRFEKIDFSEEEE